MGIESAWVLHLQNDPEVTALVGSGADARVYPLVIPQDMTQPAMAYQVIDDPQVYAHDGPTGQSRARIQLTLQGSYTQVVALRQVVQRAAHRFYGDGDVQVQARFVENIRDGWADTLAVAVRRMDCIFWYYDGGLV